MTTIKTVCFFPAASKSNFFLVVVSSDVCIHISYCALCCIYCILFFYFVFYKFIYFWLRWVFVAAHELYLVAASGGYSSLQCAGFSLWWLLLLQSTGSRCVGFSSCGAWAQQLWLTGFRAQAQQLWLTGLDAPWHVGPSRTRARTCVLCIGRRILKHCTTRKAPLLYFRQYMLTSVLVFLQLP